MPVSSQRVIAGSIIVSIAFVMELTLVPLLLPSIRDHLGLSIGQLAWVFNSYGVSVAFGVLLGGWLGDNFDAHRIFRLGVLMFAAGSAAVAFAGSFEFAIAGRILQGLGGGVFSPLIPLLLTRAAPRRPGKVLIIWGSAAGYVAALAPFFYASTLADQSWNVAFMIFAIGALAALVIVNGLKPAQDAPPSGRPRPDYREVLGSRDLWVMFIYVFCTYGSITYFLFRLPLWLEENGLPVATIGFALSMVWLSFSVISTLLRNMVDEPYVRLILLIAPTLIAVGFPLAYLCDDLGCLILSSVLVGSGLACSNAPSTQLILRFAPKGMGAASTSLDITFARLGGVVTVALLAQPAFGYSVLVIAFLSVVAFICAMIAVRSFTQRGMSQEGAT